MSKPKKRPVSSLAKRRRKSTLKDVEAPPPKAKVPKPPPKSGGDLGTSVSRLKARRGRKAEPPSVEPSPRRLMKRVAKKKAKARGKGT